MLTTECGGAERSLIFTPPHPCAASAPLRVGVRTGTGGKGGGSRSGVPGIQNQRPLSSTAPGADFHLGEQLGIHPVLPNSSLIHRQTSSAPPPPLLLQWFTPHASLFWGLHAPPGVPLGRGPFKMAQRGHWKPFPLAPPPVEAPCNHGSSRLSSFCLQAATANPSPADNSRKALGTSLCPLAHLRAQELSSPKNALHCIPLQ